MTVAVSVVSGVVAITSAVTSLAPHAVLPSAGFIVLLALVNLRGVRESGSTFAIPTYAFIVLTFVLVGSGAYRTLTGHVPTAASAHLALEHTAKVGGVFTLLLCLRAFASGCTALTGVEAISNGGVALPSRNHAVVLVSKLHSPTLRALASAKATRPHDLTALTVAIDKADAEALLAEWDARGISIPLTIIDSPYREVTRPELDYIKRIKLESPRDVVTVFIPEYVVGKWWEQLLHNPSALRLKSRLLYQPGVMVTSVPYQLRSSQDRSGENIG